MHIRKLTFRPFQQILTLSIALLLASCSMNPAYQGRGEAGIQGEWQQDTTSAQKKLVSYALYHFRFDCDSFYVQMHTFSKVNYGADTCMRNGHWTEYAKGRYEVQSDTLHLKGFFTLKSGKLKDEGGCFRSGVYEERFTFSKKTDSLYQFTNITSVSPFIIHLTKRITCNPKPL